MDDIRCFGHEHRIIDCSASFGAHDCALTQVAGVRCQGNASTCRDRDIRLIGGTYQGRVEVCYNNVWGTVCNSGWNDVGAQVACRQLGLTSGGSYFILKLSN